MKREKSIRSPRDLLLLGLLNFPLPPPAKLCLALRAGKRGFPPEERAGARKVEV